MKTNLVALPILLMLASCSSSEMMPPPPNLASNDPTDPSKPPPPPPSIADDVACRLFEWPLRPERAVEILQRTEVFTQAGVYYSGEPTPQVAAYNVLLDQPDALKYVDQVASAGGPVGRLYALAAFQLLDSERRSRLVAELRSDNTLVRTQFGCMGGHDPVSELAEVVEREKYGPYFREAKKRTYDYFDGPANICIQRTAGRTR